MARVLTLFGGGAGTTTAGVWAPAMDVWETDDEIVYAFDLVPGKIGTIAGLFFGLSFGLAGVGAVALGWLADATSIDLVYQLCAFLPLIGLLTIFLPDLGRPMRRAPIRKPALETGS